MPNRIAIIGGTGIGHRLAALGGTPIAIPTEDGLFRAKKLDLNGIELYLLQRHSTGHKTPPHLVPYKAMARGLTSLGVKACLSTAATGGLRPDWGTGLMAVCSDFIDFTFRRLTLWDREVKHVDFTFPFDPAARQAMLSAAAAVGQPVNDGGVYVCGDGPRYETPTEVAMYRKLGGDVVGMTASSEAIAFREMGVPYACLAVVTNAGSGIGGQELTHEEVVEEMERIGPIAVEILKGAARILAG